MKGKISFSIKNRHIAFKFDLERNITIITGDSGTGKTKLVNMVRMYASEGKASGVTLTCDRPCTVLEGRDWETILNNTRQSVVFIEESTRFLPTYEFAKLLQKTDNYYVIVTREPLPQIPYSIDAIKQIVKNARKPKIEKVYKNVSVKDIAAFPYDEIVVEDSKAGFLFFAAASGKRSVPCRTSNGKSNLLPELKGSKSRRILVIADAAALGSEIRELMRFKQLSSKVIDFFFPECFEWLVLKSAIFSKNADVKEILSDPIQYIESELFFSWERYFTHLLVEQTKNHPQLKYPKDKSKLPAGYYSNANMEHILNAAKL